MTEGSSKDVSFKRPTSKFKSNSSSNRKFHAGAQLPKCDMKEVVTICIGNAGCSLGSKFNEVICDEHGIDPTGTFMGESDLQLQRIDVFFMEVMGGKYVPRTVLIDLDVGNLEQIRGGMYGQTFRPDNFIFSRVGAGNNYAKGYYTEGPNILHDTLDVIRKEAEMSDCLQGFQILHAVGGGTGSGFGSLVLESLKEEYPDRIACTWTVFPSPKISNGVIEPYNTILANSHLIDSSDFTVCLDNEALYDICEYKLRFPQPQYSDLNHLIAAAMSGVTASFRFPGSTNHTLRNIATTLVPFPKLHYFIPGYAPLTSRANQPYSVLTVPTIIPELLSTNSMLTPCDPRKGTYISSSILFRGAVSPGEVVQYLNHSHSKRSKYFSEWMPNDIQLGFCDIPPRGLRLSASVLANSTAINCMWQRVMKGFNALFRRKAFLKWYTAEGMDEAEFMEALNKTQDLVSEYQTHEGKDTEKAVTKPAAKTKSKLNLGAEPEAPQP